MCVLFLATSLSWAGKTTVSKASGSAIASFLNHAPTFEKVTPLGVYERDHLEFRVHAVDSDNHSLVYSSGDLPNGATFDPGNQTLTWAVGFDQAGKYTLTFFVSDGVATSSLKVSVGVLDRVTPYFEYRKLGYPEIRMLENGQYILYLDPVVENVENESMANLNMQLVGTDVDEVIDMSEDQEVCFRSGKEWSITSRFSVTLLDRYMRGAGTFTIRVSGVTSSGNQYQQDIDFEVGIGIPKQSFFSLNRGVIYLTYEDQSHLGIQDIDFNLVPLSLPQLTTQFQIGATGHLNKDAFEDILLVDDTTGNWMMVYCDQESFYISEPKFQTHLYEGAGHEFIVLGSGDFDGDMQDEVVLQYRFQDRVEVTDMHPAMMIEMPFIQNLPSSYECLGIADYDGDEVDDLLWHDQKNDQLVLWRRGVSDKNTNVIMGQYDGETKQLLCTGIGNSLHLGESLIFTNPHTGDLSVGILLVDGQYMEEVVGSFDPNLWIFCGSGDLHANDRVDLVFQSIKNDRVLKIVEIQGLTADGSDVELDQNGYTVTVQSDLDGNGTSDLRFVSDSDEIYENIKLVSIVGGEVEEIKRYGSSKKWNLLN